MGTSGAAQRRPALRPLPFALLLLPLVLCAAPAAAQTEYLMLKFGWAPTYCYDAQRTGPYCGATTPPGAFRINRLFAADGNGNSRAGCSGPAFDASLISQDLLPQLRCTWGSYAAVHNSEALWRGVWGEDKESGVCTGLSVGDWAWLAAHLWTTYNPNKALQGAGIAAGDTSSGAAIVDAFREAYGKQPRVVCRDADTLQLSSVTLCFQGSSPYSLVDCPAGTGGCTGEEAVDLPDGPAPSDECTQFYGLGSSVPPSSPPPAAASPSPPPPAASPSPPPPPPSPSPPPPPPSPVPSPPPKAGAASGGSLNQTPEQQDGPVYYIQAQEVEWDYAPSGLNMCNGKPFNVTANSGDPSVWTEQGLGRKYRKALYRAYTDGSFQTEQERDPSEAHLGHLGPLMKAAVGQTITVYLKNALSFPVNLKVVAFEDDAAPVQPGATQAYRFKVETSAGPVPNEPGAKLYLYRSTVDLAKHGDAGLVGPLLVSNTPPVLSAARDLITVLQIINEGNSPFIEDNLAGRTPDQLGLEDQAALDEADMKHTINGYLFCNGATNLTFKQGEPARWHMASLGSETDVHNAHFHGNTALYMGRRVDQVNLLPGSTHSLDFSTENSGTWLLHCHIGDHIAAGMKAMYTVARDPSLPPHAGVKPGQTGTVRNYFIAADEVDWQYVPKGKDLCGTAGPQDLPQELAHLAGETFRKALYREYTDASFTTRRMPSGDDYIMGIMGPLLRAEVGDTIRVTFKNNLKDHAVTLHPHGVAYLKGSEGSPYEDGSTAADKGDDYVQPGTTYVYEWHVPETSGPGPRDPDSIIYMYHSHVDEVADVYSGLQGAIIIGRKGQLRPDSLVAKQVDREMVFFFSVINEAATLFTKQNAGNDSGYPAPVYRHTINGYSWCNMPQIVFQQGERVRLHIMALGTEIDIHAPNFMFQSLSLSGQETMAAAPMFPGSMHSFDLVAANPGPALLQCRVAAHVAAGMRALVEVKESFSIAEEGKSTAGAATTAGPYYITAEQQQWNYAPQGIDACANTDYGDAASVFLNRSNATIGSVYTKAVYVEYTDASFTTPKFKAGSRGLLGPTLRVEVGQVLEIVFQNRLPFEVNLMLDGGLELLSAVDDKNASLAHGAPVAARPEGGMAGGTVTYRYLSLNTTGPGTEDLPVVPYVYTSSIDPAAHSNAGLVGVLAVGAPGAFSGPSGLPEGIKDMAPLLFTIFDENASPFLKANMAGVAEPATEEAKAAFEESNLKHSINGLMYCNLPGLSYLRGSTVRFLLLGMGSQVDLHSVVFDGQLLRSGRGAGSVELIPTVARAADVTMQQAGTSGIYCAVHDHYVAGMHATLEVK